MIASMRNYYGAIGVMGLYFIARVIYLCGYANGGPSGRVVGSTMGAIGIFGSVGVCFASNGMWAGKMTDYDSPLAF